MERAMHDSNATGPTAAELEDLIRSLAAYRPLADFLRG